MRRNFADETRANEFDRWVGLRQILHARGTGVGKTLLDVGCGIGQFTPLYLEKFEKVVGLDASEEYLKEARKASNTVEYVYGFGEDFELQDCFDTIVMTNLLEHVDDPVKVLKNCRRHLSVGGRIIAYVPNANSVTRRLGVLMGFIDSTNHISEKERDIFGHQRVYTLESLIADAKKAGLRVTQSGGILYKPLPNEMLLLLCKKYGDEWRDRLIDALIEFGEDRPEECAQIYFVGE